MLLKSTHIPGEISAWSLTQMRAEDGQVAALTPSSGNGFILPMFLFCAFAEWINYLHVLKYIPSDAVNDLIGHHYSHDTNPFKGCWKLRFVLLLREKHERKKTTTQLLLQMQQSPFINRNHAYDQYKHLLKTIRVLQVPKKYLRTPFAKVES